MHADRFESYREMIKNFSIKTCLFLAVGFDTSLTINKENWLSTTLSNENFYLSIKSGSHNNSFV